MANTKTAKENILINKRNRARNVHFKTRMRNALKKARVAIETKAEKRQEITRLTLQIIDKTVSKGIIKKKTASRTKSRLALLLNKSL